MAHKKLAFLHVFPSSKIVICPVRLAVRTPDSHSGDRGSIPLRGAIYGGGCAPAGVFLNGSRASRMFSRGRFESFLGIKCQGSVVKKTY